MRGEGDCTHSCFNPWVWEPTWRSLRNIVAAMAPRPEVADAIKSCVDDQGGFKDGASPELRRARSQRAAAEAKLRRALQNANGQVTTHQGRVVLAVTPPAPAGSLIVGVAAGGGLVLIEPPGVVLLNGQLAQCVASEETAIDAIRRRLTNEVNKATPDLFAALDVVTRLDAIAARAVLRAAEEVKERLDEMKGDHSSEGGGDDGISH